MQRMVPVIWNTPLSTEPFIKGRVVISDRFLRSARVPKAGSGFGYFPHTETLFNPAGFSGGVFYGLSDPNQSVGFRKPLKAASAEPSSGCQLYRQFTTGGSDMSIDSVLPPDCSPNKVPRS